MQRKKVGRSIQLFDRIRHFHAVGFENVGRDERVESAHLHAQRLAVTGHDAADVAVSLDSEPFAADLRSGAGGELIARHKNHHAHDQFGHGVRVLPRGIHHDNPFGGAGGQVDVVVTGTGANDDFQFLGGGDYFGRHFVAADNQPVGIFHGRQQIGLVRIFFQQGQFVTRPFNDFAYSVDRRFRKRLFGSYQYLHSFYIN